MNFSVARIVVCIKVRRNRVGAVAKSKEFCPPGNTIITVGTHHTLVVVLVINSLETTGSIRSLKKAIPSMPVAQSTPIYAIVDRPSSGFSHAR
jgi:hypothetical protein